MAGGFATPGLMFLGAVHKSERDFCRPVYSGLRAAGYTRFVEVCSGALAMALVARSAGWEGSQMESSDVTLFSSIVGYLTADRDLSELGMMYDGVPVETSGTPVEQAAQMMYAELHARMTLHAGMPYWDRLIENLEDEREDHIKSFLPKLADLRTALRGMTYEPLDLWVHLDRVADDPHTIVNANPPSYDAGFEKFYDTGGRITWNEPTYEIFDPAVDYDRLREYMADKPALMINLEENREPGTVTHPLYVRPMGQGKRAYLLSNRPEEVFAINGGPKIARTSRGKPLEASRRPVIPLHHIITEHSTITAIPVSAGEADYYRELWMHKFTTGGGPHNILYLIDGYAAGIAGLSLDTILHPHNPKSLWRQHALMRFAFGAPHAEYRLTRLITMLTLRRGELDMFLSPKNSMFIELAVGMVTNERTRHPEVKGLRGIMKREVSKKDGDMYQLLYAAPWNRHETREQVLGEWLSKERRYQNQSQTSMAGDSTA